MPMFVKMGNGGTGYLGQPASSKRAMARRLRRRELKPGYPWEGKFATRAEVDRYLSGENIECLLCGRMLKSLGLHLSRIHGVTEEKYKERYGLPLTRGLVCEETHGNYSKSVTERPDRIDHIKRLASEFQPLVASAKRRKSPIQYAGTEEYSENEWDSYIAEIYGGKTPREVSCMPGMPGTTTVFRKRLSDKEFDDRLGAAVAALPFDVQARMQRMGSDFRTEVEKLFKSGLSDHKIAPILGVAAMTVNRITKALRAQANS